MAHVYFTTIYHLELTDDDLKIICLALTGKIKSLDDRKAAHALHVCLLKEQEHRLREQATVIANALQRAREDIPIQEKGDHP